MSIVELKNLSNDDLKKRLALQIDIEDWTDECGKCGYPRLLHKELHWEAACKKDAEVPNVLKKNWEEYTSNQHTDQYVYYRTKEPFEWQLKEKLSLADWYRGLDRWML